MGSPAFSWKCLWFVFKINAGRGDVQRATLLPGIACGLFVGLHTPHEGLDQRRRSLEGRGDVARLGEYAADTRQACPSALVAKGSVTAGAYAGCAAFRRYVADGSSRSNEKRPSTSLRASPGWTP